MRNIIISPWVKYLTRERPSLELHLRGKKNGPWDGGGLSAVVRNCVIPMAVDDIGWSKAGEKRGARE